MIRDPIKSSARTLQVLELFSEVRRPLRLTEIYERLGIPQSSATILLKSMLLTGYLNYDRSSRTYFSTSRVAALGDWINHYMFGPGDLADLICSVRDRTSEAVAVSAQNDIFVQHLRIVEPSHEFKLSPPEGSMRMLIDSAPGIALLSRLQPDTVDKIVRHISIYRRKRVDAAALSRQLDWVRQEGYALLSDHPVEGYSVIAVPLPQARHRIPLSLAVGGQNSRIMRCKTEILCAIRDALGAYASKLSTIGGGGAGVLEAPLLDAQAGFKSVVSG